MATVSVWAKPAWLSTRHAEIATLPAMSVTLIVRDFFIGRALLFKWLEI
jgi:hypothetical protein